MVRVNVVATLIDANETNVTTPTHTPAPAIVGVGVSVGSRRPFLLMASGLGGAPNHVSGVGAASLCCRPALATAALQVHNCGGRSCPSARLMKWPGMSPRLRRTAGHTIAIRDAVVVMSSVQQGRVSASVMQSRRGMVTKNASEHETTTIGVDDDLRRSELLDPLPVSPRPTPPPRRLFPTFLIPSLSPSIAIGSTANGPSGTRQEIGVRAKPERTAPVGTPIGLIALCPRAAVGVVAKLGAKYTSATSTPPPLLLRPSPSSGVVGSIDELEGESASFSLHLGGVDVSANLDATKHNETPTPPRGPLPFAPSARGSPASSHGPS